jgi:CRISPR-associated DxTHG motif protein
MNGFGSAFGVQGTVTGTGAGGNGSTYGGYFSNTTTVAGNNYGLYVSTASGGDYGIYQTGTGSNYFGSNTSIIGTLAVQGAITEDGNNVLTNLDTASLSSRIDAKLSATDTTFLSDRINLKYDKTGGTISGAVTLSTTTATPTSLLGKDGSNVVGSVTTVAQTGLFGRGSVSNAVTDANGNITVAHGFNFTPIMAFANLPGQTTNIINVKEVDGTNITFVVRDGATNNVLNTQTVTKIEFFAIK